MDKTITLELTDYLVEGIAQITFWDNSTGYIDMKPYHVTENDMEKILAGVNDNGFGCQSIDKVDVHLYANYQGYLVFVKSMYNIEVPNKYGKRGV